MSMFSRHKEAPMTQSGYAHFADALLFVHGPYALKEAARHAELCDDHATRAQQHAAFIRGAGRCVGDDRDPAVLVDAGLG